MEGKISKGIKKLMCILLASAMTVTFIPGGFAWPDSASADDTRTKVSEIEATSNMNDVFGYGKEIEKATFTITKGAPAHVASSMGGWRKKNADGTFDRVYSGRFSEGTWIYRVQVRIDGSYGATHVLNTPSTFTVDGQRWSGGENPSVDDDYSYEWYDSPELTITDKGPLTFEDSDSFDIPAGSVGCDISEVDLYSSVYGGTAPYTFSKLTGPGWLNVSSAGKITGTRPDTAQAVATAAIQVKDADNTARTIEINVGAVIERTKVSEIEATSNMNDVFGYGKEIEKSTFTITKGAPAYVASSMGGWYKKNNDGRFDRVYSGHFSEGTWIYRVQVRIDGSYGATHVLNTPSTFTVDGQRWSGGEEPSVDDDLSYEWYDSPELTIGKVSVENGTADSEMAATGDKITITANPASSGKMFDKWVVVSGGVELADAGKTTTTFVMKDRPVTVKATYKDIPALKSVTTKLSGYRAVRASWTKIAGVTGYKVYYKKSTASSYTYKGSTTGASMNLANLATGTKYYVKVVPYVTESGKTEFGPAKVSSGIYTLKKLNAPTISKKSSGKVTVKWNNIAGETGYQISKSTSKSKTGTKYTVKTTSGKSKVLSVKKYRTYYYKVRAYRSVDGKKIYAPWSQVKSFKLK